MIERYSREEMVQIWSPSEKFKIWFEIEAHACDAQAQLGVIPLEAAKKIWEKGKFDIEKIDEIEKIESHDLPEAKILYWRNSKLDFEDPSGKSNMELICWSN